MDAAGALADLTEISSQVEAAVVFDDDGTVLASTLADGGPSERLARAALDLLTAARERTSSGGDRTLTQLEVALRDGSIFVARDEDRRIVATTSAGPTSGLVFYDLKTCLRALGETPAKPKRRRTKAQTDA